MAFEFPRAALSEALAAVGAAVPGKSPKEILLSVLITCEHGEIAMQATDLEIGIRYGFADLPAPMLSESLVINYRKFQQILSTTTDDLITMEAQDNGQILIRAGRTRFLLPTENPDLFPRVQEFHEQEIMLAPSADFRKALRRTVYATDPATTRYALGGVLLEHWPKGELHEMSLVATDGRRLVQQIIPVSVSGPVKEWKTQVIPVKAIRLIEKNLDASVVEISIDPARGFFMRSGRTVITSRMVEGRYPRYQDVFPKETPYRIPITSEALARSLEQASIVTTDDSRGVDMIFKPQELAFKVASSATGQADTALDIQYEGPDTTVTLDPRYVLDSLTALGKADLTMRLIDERTAFGIETQDGFNSVIMPLTRDR